MGGRKVRRLLRHDALHNSCNGCNDYRSSLLFSPRLGGLLLLTALSRLYIPLKMVECHECGFFRRVCLNKKMLALVIRHNTILPACGSQWLAILAGAVKHVLSLSGPMRGTVRFLR